MPAPSNGMRLLVLPRNPSPDEWLELVEARVERLKPHLKNFPLTELGDVDCLHSSGDSRHAIMVNSPAVKQTAPEYCSLKSQGLFCTELYLGGRRRPNAWQDGFGYRPAEAGELYFWGLLRSGSWVRIQVEFRVEDGLNDRRYEHAVRVVAKECLLSDILLKLAPFGLTAHKTWQFLGAQVKEWEKRRREFHAIALAELDIVRAEEQVANLLIESRQ